MVLTIIDLDQLNTKNYSKKMKKNGYQLIAYLADWCGHCVEFKPKWNIIKQKLIRISHGLVLTRL